MTEHMQRDIENLKKKILALCAIVEESVNEAVRAVTKGDAALAQQVIDKDPRIDQIEVEVEEDCLKALALHQPVAIDLRFIVAVLKINSDLERIGDLTVNIAERAVFLATQDLADLRRDLGADLDFRDMIQKTTSMLRRSLDAFVGLNTELARSVCASDDEVDAMNRQMYVVVQDAIRAHPDRLEPLIHLLSVSRHLERIADYATNIAEDLIYMIDGEIVRHRVEVYVPHAKRSQT